MGCYDYQVEHISGDPERTVGIKFQAMRCLCNFPEDWEEDQRLEAEIVQSLAYLGAAVVMAHAGRLEPDHGKGHDVALLPEVLPDWICKSIDAHIRALDGRP